MNEHHRRNILTTLQHVHQEFAAIEAILAAIGVDSPLSQYVLDVQPMQRRVIEDYLNRIRREMVSVMQRLDICSDTRRTSASWAIRTRLLGTSIALAEMEPGNLTGYGELTPDDQVQIRQACADLDRLVNQLDRYLQRPSGESVSRQLARLEGCPVQPEMLISLDEIITRHHLLEFRPILDMIVSRLETEQFEIAFFGRVSSGKSSLLNHILGRDVLPVGVTPVTAVPTRLRAGDQPEIVVIFELSKPQAFPVEQIAEFVTEEGNPDNAKHVRQVEVFLPSSTLGEGIVLVDTPGVGSLATCGAAQTFAYLPRCDLGVLLVDAGSSLNHEDLSILQGLSDAAVPSLVLLSKSDLLSDQDRVRVVRYAEEQIRKTLGCSTKVWPVSIMGAEADLTRQWFEDQVRPLLTDYREKSQASLRRKVANLRESVASTLYRRVQLQGHGASALSKTDAAAAGRLLEDAAALIAKATGRTVEPVEKGVADALEALLDRAAELAASGRATRLEAGGLLRGLVLDTLANMASLARNELTQLELSLAETLKSLGDSIGSGGDEPLDDGLPQLGPLPAVDERTLHQVPEIRPWAILAWWPFLARIIFRHRVRKHAYWPIHSVTRGYRQKLREWTRVGLQRIVEAYEARAGLYRERLKEAAEAGSDGDATDTSQLLKDLAVLRSGLPMAEQASAQPLAAGR